MMRNSIQHIKMILTRHGSSLLIAAVFLVMFSCTSKEEKQSGDSQVTNTKTNSRNMDSMSSDAVSRSSHNIMEGMQMNDGRSMADTARSDTYWTSLPANQTIISSQDVIEPVETDMNFVFRGNGYIAFDPRRNQKIPVRIGGRIEKLYVKYNYQYVRKGEKILELYSPEINTYIEEFLFLNREIKDSILQEKAKHKLLLLGLTPSQINSISQTGKAPFTISIYSPFEGYVLFDPSGPTGMNKAGYTSAGMGGGMNSGGSASPSIESTILPDNSIREGMYIGKDQTLFWINDFKVVWGIVAFTAENEKYIRKGLPVTVTSELFPEQPFLTSIQFMEQVYKGGQKFSQARVYLSNASKFLKQNSLITAKVSIPVKSIMIPAGSVYYLGRISIVWVRAGVTKEGSNIFQSRVVRIGHRDGDNVEILEGLNTREVIARDAGYLADSETNIKF